MSECLVLFPLVQGEGTRKMAITRLSFAQFIREAIRYYQALGLVVRYLREVQNRYECSPEHMTLQEMRNVRELKNEKGEWVKPRTAAAIASSGEDEQKAAKERNDAICRAYRIACELSEYETLGAALWDNMVKSLDASVNELNLRRERARQLVEMLEPIVEDVLEGA